MAKRPTCNTCPYYYRNPTDLNGPGECRESPPKATIVSVTDRGPIIVATWPPTRTDQWCGKHPRFPAYIDAESKSLSDAGDNLPSGPPSKILGMDLTY